MAKRLFLLDGMALVYRAHFAFIARPILTSKGLNTSALYGFTQTVLEILSKQQPTHLAVAFDTEAPTPRHTAYPEYKATRKDDMQCGNRHFSRTQNLVRSQCAHDAMIGQPFDLRPRGDAKRPVFG